MKYFFSLFVFFSISEMAFSQSGNPSKVTTAAIYHDFDKLGSSINSIFRLNEYFSLGPGFDVSSYEGEVIVPLYLNVRASYPGRLSPYFNIHGGPTIYSNDKYPYRLKTPDGALEYTVNDKYKGKYFYGVGAGVSYELHKLAGIYLQYSHRWYRFTHDGVNMSVPKEFDKAIGVISLGFEFYLSKR